MLGLMINIKVIKCMKKSNQIQTIKEISDFPHLLEETLKDITDKQLIHLPSDGGWTIAQNIHHIADVHVNKYAHIKQILVEDSPLLKEHAEDIWITLRDS